MAVDTRNKRASCLGIVLAVNLTLPAPDATVAQSDRQHVAYCYSGLSAQAVSPLNLHEATTATLMPDRTTALFSGEYDTVHITPRRTTEDL